MIARSRQKPVAVLDIGSNSIRLDIRASAEPGAEVLIRRKALCRLGKDMTIDGDLSKTRVDYTLKTLKKYRKIMDGNDVSQIRAVATAAVRTARNRDEFVARVRKETGIKVDVISGDEEARLAALGVIHNLSFPLNGVVADLGGGSLELVRVEKNVIREKISLPLGLQRIPDTDMATRQMLWTHFEKLPWLKKSIPFLVAVGGTWRACGRLDLAHMGKDHKKIHEHTVESERVVDFCDWLITGTFKKSKVQDAIEKHRIKEIPLAAFVMKTLYNYCNKPSVVFSQAGIREGCFVEMAGIQHRLAS